MPWFRRESDTGRKSNGDSETEAGIQACNTAVNRSAAQSYIPLPLKKRDKADKYAQAKAEITAIFHENKGRCGYRRITDELHNRKIFPNHKTVQRLMKELRPVCRVRMKKYRSYKGERGEAADNLPKREFRSEKPNRKRVTDVTEFRPYGWKLCLSPNLDLYSGDIATYTLSDSPIPLMVTTTPEQAFAKIPDKTGLPLHSDRGRHSRRKRYREMLLEKVYV